MAKNAAPSPSKRKSRFLLFYFLTALLTIALLWGLLIPAAYNDPGDDIFELEFVVCLAYAILFVILVLTLCAEAELFHTVYYFARAERKTRGKTVCNLLAPALPLLSLGFLILDLSGRFLSMKSAEKGMLLSFGLYLAVRIVSLFLPKGRK